MALTRAVSPSFQSGYRPGIFSPIDAMADGAVSVALSWTLAILLLNLTRYRATHRELACQQGISAGVAIVVERAAELFDYAVVFPLANPFFPVISLS